MGKAIKLIEFIGGFLKDFVAGERLTNLPEDIEFEHHMQIINEKKKTPRWPRRDVEKPDTNKDLDFGGYSVDFDHPCPKCHGTVGHMINCPFGSAKSGK